MYSNTNVVEKQIKQLATVILRKELLALNYKHINKLNHIVDAYVQSIIWNYLDEQGANILQFVEKHAVFYAQHLKMDENNN